MGRFQQVFSFESDQVNNEISAFNNSSSNNLNLMLFSVSNVDGCNADCAKTPDCVAFTYLADKTRSNCELKNDKGAVHLQRFTNKALVGGMRLLR